VEKIPRYAHYVGSRCEFSLTTPFLIVENLTMLSPLSTRRHAQMPEKKIKEDDKEELRSYEGEEE